MADRDPSPSAREIPAWFRRLSRISWGFVGVVVAVGLIVLGLNALRELVIPLVMAAFFAAIFAPGVDWLEKRRVPRSLGSVILILVIAAVLVGALTVVVVGVIDQSDELTERFNEAQDEVETIIEDSQFNELVDQVRESLDDGGSVARDGLGSAIGSFLDSASGFASGLVLGVVLLYYLLKDGSALVANFVSGRNRKNTEQYQRIVSASAGSIRAYFKGKTLLALVQGVFVTVVLAIMGVPLAGSVGVVNFIGAYIP
ncbi:MAG: AI-2E family transporter, partial [Acidimicrobiales bacterium]